MKTTTRVVDERRSRVASDSALPQWEFSGGAVRKIARRVLVVDDEPLIRWSVAETLASIGLSVDQAGDAASALKKMTTTALGYDVVVLDLRLPDMKDLSLLGTIRQMYPDVSVVLMTAYGTDEVLERAVALGACTVLNKPFEFGRLIDAVFGTAT